MVEKKPTRAETQARTRARLLDAARRVISAGGLAAATVRTISEEAGFSLGAFYSNFASKEDLLLELMRKHMSLEGESLKRMLSESSCRPETILDRIAVWLEELNADLDWSALAIELALHAKRNKTFSEKFRPLQTEHQKVLAQIIENLFEMTGRSPVMTADEVAVLVMTIAQGMALQREEQTPDPAGKAIYRLLKTLVVLN